MPTNVELINLLSRMADVMQILGHDTFRVAAYQRAARAVDDMTVEIAAVGPDLGRLMEIPGIGKGMAQHIAEYLTTGHIHAHDELVAQLPPGLLKLLDIQGLGPKRIAQLWKEAGVTSLDDLKKKLAGDELTQLKGFGPKLVENLRQNLAFAAQSARKFRLGSVLPLGRWLVSELSRLPGVTQADCAGSLRRGKDMVGDLDILIAAHPDDAPRLSRAFIELGPLAGAQVLGQGATKTTVRTTEGLQIDLRIVPPGSFGAALLYFTGSKEHNVQLRQHAIHLGLKLNEYGLFHGENAVAGATEAEVYQALKLAWIPPELREGRNEIDLAGRGELPVLLDLADIRAELHCHTTASDGRLSILEIAQVALERGFHTLAITDHSVSQTVANGLSAERLLQHVENVRMAAGKLKGRITLLAGSEVDILGDGTLDYPNSVLKELDLVVASPHAALTQEPRKATARLVKAIHNPYVTILGHPTGRLMPKRPGLSPDMKTLIAAAQERGIALEINANSYRLDLRDNHARAALEAGVKLAINTDAHSPADFDQLPYGVLTARRAGAGKHDVINCLPAEALRKWIAATRA